MGLILLALKNIFIQKEKSLVFFLTISLSISIILLLLFISFGMRNNLKKGSGEDEAVYTLKMNRTKLNMTYRGIPVGQQDAREMKELPSGVLEYFKSFPIELELISLGFRKVSLISFREDEIIAVGNYSPDGNPMGEQLFFAGHKLKYFQGLQGTNVSLPGLGNVRIKNFLEETGTEKDNILYYQIKESTEYHIIRFISRLKSVQDIKNILTDGLPGYISLLEISGKSKENDLRFSFYDKLINYFTYIILLMIIPIFLLFNVIGFSIIRGREQDMAVLRVVGFKKRHIARLVFIELAFIGITSTATGILLSIPLVIMVQRLGVLPEFTIADIGIPLISGISLVTASVILLLSGVAPVSRASGLDPVTAFRTIN